MKNYKDEIKQTPPSYSALKLNGTPLYMIIQEMVRKIKKRN